MLTSIAIILIIGIVKKYLYQIKMYLLFPFQIEYIQELLEGSQKEKRKTAWYLFRYYLGKRKSMPESISLLILDSLRALPAEDIHIKSFRALQNLKGQVSMETRLFIIQRYGTHLFDIEENPSNMLRVA